jgi:hypothetical protein
MTEMDQQIGFIATSVLEKAEYHSSYYRNKTTQNQKCFKAIEQKDPPAKPTEVSQKSDYTS